MESDESGSSGRVFRVSFYLCSMTLTPPFEFATSSLMPASIYFFRNHPEVHVYDVACPAAPCLRLGDSSHHSRSEGVLKAAFLPSSSSSARRPSALLTGGNYGTVRLWSITFKPQPRQNKQRQRRSTSNNGGNGALTAKCQWSVPAFGPEGRQGVCDILVLPSPTPAAASSLQSTSSSNNANEKKPLVFLSGNASSLALLNTGKCTRKAFSTTVTPTIAASWDLYRLVLRELSKLDPEAKLPARRWMAVHGLRLLGSRRCARGGGKGGGDASWFKIGMVAKCGWMFVAQLFIPAIVAGGSVNTDSIRLSLRIVHQTPRVQLYNSSNERLAMLGGMALQFSLPEIPVPSSAGGQGMVWLGDVKALRYTMPSKDKYVLCEGYGKLASSPQSDTCADHGSNSRRVGSRSG